MMKYSLPTVVALAAVALARPLPTPAGGWYYPIPFPGSGGGGPFGGGPFGNPSGEPYVPPIPKDPYPDGVIVCNCKNAATKDSFVSPLCEAAGGVEMYLLTKENAPRQHLCAISRNLDDVFSDANCAKHDKSFSSSCTTWS